MSCLDFAFNSATMVLIEMHFLMFPGGNDVN